jgi:hypothetical protein
MLSLCSALGADGALGDDGPAAELDDALNGLLNSIPNSSLPSKADGVLEDCEDALAGPCLDEGREPNRGDGGPDLLRGALGLVLVVVVDPLRAESKAEDGLSYRSMLSLLAGSAGSLPRADQARVGLVGEALPDRGGERVVKAARVDRVGEKERLVGVARPEATGERLLWTLRISSSVFESLRSKSRWLR